MTQVRTRERAMEILLENNIATMEEILLVANLNGYTMETLRSILYVRTKYRDFDQYIGKEV